MSDAEVDSLVIGDVIRKGETYRVVRNVVRYPRGVAFVYVTIRNRSWTGRGYTLLDRWMLRQYAKTGARVTLKGDLNAKIQRVMTSQRPVPVSALTYADVRGIP